jgi:hypothetical protein
MKRVFFVVAFIVSLVQFNAAFAVPEWQQKRANEIYNTEQDIKRQNAAAQKVEKLEGNVSNWSAGYMIFGIIFWNAVVFIGLFKISGFSVELAAALLIGVIALGIWAIFYESIADGIILLSPVVTTFVWYKIFSPK